MTQSRKAAARLTLAKARPMTSLLDAEIIAFEDADIVFYKADWVPLYFDRAHAVTSPCGRRTAYRAVTLQGAFLWLVFTPEKTRGYHAACTDPFEALEEAEHVWARRRAVRQNWAEVEQASRDLITGRIRMDVRVEDLIASPLCTMGIDGFRNRIGLGRVSRIPGWLAALLMKVEPQVGFVLHAAMQRHAAEAGAADVGAIAQSA